jgi:CheY-like chemotaxis protein
MKPAQIVLIEDNPADVLLVKLALAEGGIDHSLIEFKNGAEAVHTLCDEEPIAPVRPDAILLDLNTPRTDGFDALNKLRQRFAHVPIAILTSSRARSDRHRAALQGVRYVEKESELDAFLSTVSKAVRDMLSSRNGS